MEKALKGTDPFLQTPFCSSQNNYFTGLGMLHGSNSTVGDFRIVGWAEALRNGGFNYRVTATFNDIIDPKISYKNDVLWSNFAKTLFNPKDYNIHISWDLERSYGR